MQENNLYNSSFSIAETTENYTTLKDLYDKDESIREKLAGSFVISTRRETVKSGKDLLLCFDTIYNLSESNINAMPPLYYTEDDSTYLSELTINYDDQQFDVNSGKLTIKEKYLDEKISYSTTIKKLEDDIEFLKTKISQLENKQ